MAIGAPAHADGPVASISDSEARHLAESVVAGLGPTIGEVHIKSYADNPSDPVTTIPTSPIELFVGDSRIEPVPGVYSNCQANPPGRMIKCDLRFLDDLIDGFALLRREQDRDDMRAKILRMVLAHEFGHVVLHHPLSAYHGDANGFSIFRYVHYRIELAADAYAVSLIDRTGGDANGFYYAIVELANAAVRKSLCPDTFPAGCPCPGYTNVALCSRIPLGPGLMIADEDRVPVTLSGSHPEFVARFARMLYLSRDPQVRAIYGPEAREVLRRVVVKDESGKLEPAKNLFR